MLLVCNVIYVGLATIGQKRLDLMLGCSSVMHMGYIFLGIASFNVIGLSGAALLMFAHGLSIAAMFAIAGQLRERTGTLVFTELGGLAQAMPFLGFTFASLAVMAWPNLRLTAAGVLVVWPFDADAAFTFVRRALRGERVMEAHRSHLYQRMNQRGLSHAAVSLIYTGLAAVGAMVGIILLR